VSTYLIVFTVEEILLEKFEKLDDKCELINNKLDQRGSSGIDSARNNVLVPGKDHFYTFI
jgi:hypothetical protein